MATTKKRSSLTKSKSKSKETKILQLKSHKDPAKAERATQAMPKMQKIDIAALKAAVGSNDFFFLPHKISTIFATLHPVCSGVSHN
ncbi:hypothetical protein LPTSP3_g32010 [Leptospira kobayashii]|uniref:Uncharacterized protein n=1 Tax=Leptospira kobayashii TaxID=1917830 RepID=A0ABN6KM99_9LEPT|nr:hypothetical protein LPTSP3_g32010 [Leptospira kobayashii]